MQELVLMTQKTVSDNYIESILQGVFFTIRVLPANLVQFILAVPTNDLS